MFVQGSLLDGGETGIDPGAAWARTQLDERSWIDVAPGWLRGSGALFDELLAADGWHQGRRRMWDQVVDDPRLTWRPDRADEPAAITEMRRELQARYGVPLGGAGCNLYRDGSDSVAFHRDQVLRDATDSIVAIASLGATRAFRVRPLGGGPSIAWRPAGGDLLVMGGECQLRWEHGVPKCRSAGPRISVMLRWHAS